MKFEDQINDYYGEQHPTDEFWKNMEDERKAPVRRYWHWGSLAASIAIIFVLGFWWQNKANALEEEISAEIANRHLASMQMRIETENLEELSHKLNRCKYSLKSDSPHLSGYKMVGGQYCSVKQRLAVHMKLKDKNCGRVDTLYVTELKEELNKLSEETERTVGDVDVIMWKDNGRLFVLARSE